MVFFLNWSSQQVSAYPHLPIFRFENGFNLSLQCNYDGIMTQFQCSPNMQLFTLQKHKKTKRPLLPGAPEISKSHIPPQFARTVPD